MWHIDTDFTDLAKVRLHPEFQLPRQTPSGRKVRGRKERRRRKKERRIMPSLVATTSALARKMCVRTHFVRTFKRYDQAQELEGDMVEKNIYTRLQELYQDEEVVVLQGAELLIPGAKKGHQRENDFLVINKSSCTL